jgi:hypothetical protein
MDDTVEPASEAISQAIEPITTLLSEIIAPDGRTFTLDELVARHGHPTENYRDLEFEEEEKFWDEISGGSDATDT